MKAILLLILLVGLAACAAEISPYAVEITDRAQYAADLKACQGYVQEYPKHFSVGAVGAGIVEGAAQSAAAGAINPIIPAIGALGGGVQAGMEGLNLSSENGQKMVALCMAKKGERSRAYLVMDPNE